MRGERPISSETITEKSVRRTLKDMDGILVLDGERGIEGKIEAIRYVRENKIPFFGICLGMQCAVVEFGRNVVGLKMPHQQNYIKTRLIRLSTLWKIKRR